jgi:hypothetical protein
LQGVNDKAAAEATRELKDFLKEEAEAKLVQLHLGTAKNPQKDKTELADALKLAIKLGLDMQQFALGWQKKRNDLGLTLFNPPPPPSLLAAGGQSSFNSASQEQKSGYEPSPEDQAEILFNRMRAIYMVRAMRGDILTAIETAFKMRKLKNGLIKLGYSIGDQEKLRDQLKQEGEALARMRFLEMLQEAYCERATLYELAGPAHTLIERKIKGILSNLERLGAKLGKIELEAIRDKTNPEMFDISLEELQTTTMALKARPNPGLEKKQLLLVKLLTRLKEESKLGAPVPAVESAGEKV